MKTAIAWTTLALIALAPPAFAGQLHGTTLDREDLGLSRFGDTIPAGEMTLSNTSRVTGTVTDVDRTTGMIALQTSAGDMRIQFPPEQVRGLNEGSQVTAELTLAPAVAAGDAPSDQPGSTHSITGRVSTIDQENGFVSLDTNHGPMRVRFPAASLRGIEAGDRMTIGISLRQ